MKILLVSHPPLAAELGAAQLALNLADALRAGGHDVIAWSPEPLPPGGRWWQRWQRQQRAIDSFAAGAGPFDLIDTPAITASRALAGCGRLVVRSTQPELRYLGHEVASDFARRRSPRALAHGGVAARQAAAILGGWHRAAAILCLGRLELDWMRRRFPWWRPKLGMLRCAPSAGERAALADVRRRREASAVAVDDPPGTPRRGAPGGGTPGRPARSGVRFLWIGRWTSHKGTGGLLRFMRDRAAAHPEDSFTVAGCGLPEPEELGRGGLGDGRPRRVPSFSRSQLPALLADHDAGLFTSTVEGWGLSLNEMLESGMPVYGTQAGAVPDLLPFFPGALRPFPPPAAGPVPPAPRLDLAANGYEAQFSWDAIAAEYERQVLAAVARSQGPHAPPAPRASPS